MGTTVTGRRRPRIVSQTGLILGGQILAGIALFVTTPYIALGLGAELYGLYTILFLFLGYSTALDLGLSFALVKHVAEYDPQTHRREIDSLVNTATAVYGMIAVLFVVALLVGREWIAKDLLRVPTSQMSLATGAVVLLACSVPFATATTVFNALFRGLLRFEYLSLFSVANAVVYSAGAALLVMTGASIPTVMGWYAAVTATSALAQWAVLRRVLPGFRPVPRLATRRLRQLFGFGGFMAINQLSSIALLQLDRLVIARVLSVSMVAYYAIPLNVSGRLNMLGAAAATVAFPHSSASTARGELDDFRKQHLQSARMVAWFTLAPALAVIVFADQLLRYWLSPEFALHGAMPLRVLAFGRVWISIASLDAVSIEGSGRPWVTSGFMVFTGALNVVGLLVLTRVWGLVGAAASVTVSLLVLAFLDVWYCSRNVTRTPAWVWARSVLAPTLATAGLTIPVLLLLRRIVRGLPSLLVVALAGTALVTGVGYWLFLSGEERKWVKTQIARFWSSTPGTDLRERAVE